MRSNRKRLEFSASVEGLETRNLLNGTWTVTNLSGSPGVHGSLPWAVEQSNMTPSTPYAPNVINFNSSTAGKEIDRTTGPMYVTKSLNINGSGQTISGSGTSQGFIVGGLDTTVNFSSLMITHCRADGNVALGNDANGGAIDNWGYGGIGVVNCTFTDDYSAGSGGAISGNRGSLWVNGNTFANNTAGYYGGAIATGYGVPQYFVGSSTPFFLNNQAGVNGGAVECQTGYYSVYTAFVFYNHNFVTIRPGVENDVFLY